MTPNADGPDISRWNPVAPGGWDVIPQYRLISTKATGTSAPGVHEHIDPTFDENWEQMRRRQFEFRGCFHWLRSDWPMADQVELLHRALAAHGGLQDGEFIQLDWERTDSLPDAPFPTVAQVEEWIALAERHWPGRIIVYSADWVPGFKTWRAMPHRAAFPLWYASYRLTGDDNGWVKTAQYHADLWQWTSSHPIPGIDDPTIDMNHVFHWSTLQAITTPSKVAAVMYPNGYNSTLVTERRMRELHEPKMHPNFAAPLFAWIASMGGDIGIGGGWRLTQPDKDGFAPDGKSFHQWQTFASGITAYAAVDLVRRNPNGGAHLSVRWSDSADAPLYGLHTFIRTPDEPWHMQNANLRGYASWLSAGRPDPVLIAYPGATPPKPPPETGEPVVTTIIEVLNPAERIMDSRWWDEDGRFGDDMPDDDGIRTIPCPKAAGLGAVVITVTAVSPKGGGFATVFASGETPPGSSCLNYGPSEIVVRNTAGTIVGRGQGLPAIANTTVVPVAPDGSFKVYLSSNSHLVIDLVGVLR